MFLIQQRHVTRKKAPKRPSLLPSAVKYRLVGLSLIYTNLSFNYGSKTPAHFMPPAFKHLTL